MLSWKCDKCNRQVEVARNDVRMANDSMKRLPDDWMIFNDDWHLCGNCYRGACEVIETWVRRKDFWFKKDS